MARYFTNAVKTILIVKPEHLTRAQQFFADTNIQITARGQRHLGSGGFRGVSRFPRKPPLKNDCITIKCFNYRGVHLDRDTLIRAVTVATKVVCRKLFNIFYVLLLGCDLFFFFLVSPYQTRRCSANFCVSHVNIYLHLLNWKPPL